jgi:hypothetical protein
MNTPALAGVVPARSYLGLESHVLQVCGSSHVAGRTDTASRHTHCLRAARCLRLCSLTDRSRRPSSAGRAGLDRRVHPARGEGVQEPGEAVRQCTCRLRGRAKVTPASGGRQYRAGGGRHRFCRSGLPPCRKVSQPSGGDDRNASDACIHRTTSKCRSRAFGSPTWTSSSAAASSTDFRNLVIKRSSSSSPRNTCQSAA